MKSSLIKKDSECDQYTNVLLEHHKRDVVTKFFEIIINYHMKNNNFFETNSEFNNEVETEIADIIIMSNKLNSINNKKPIRLLVINYCIYAHIGYADYFLAYDPNASTYRLFSHTDTIDFIFADENIESSRRNLEISNAIKMSLHRSTV